MDTLRAPLDSIRRRVYREIAARRAIPANEVDAAAVRRFWSSLSPAVRLDVLRFTDASIVQQVHSYMITLLKADIWSRMNDVSSVSDVTPRLSGFEFEAPAERDCLGSLRAPIAMLATEEFAVDDNLLDMLEQELGSQLLDGRPALLRKDWSTVFDPAPGRWEELQQQVYRLVELAIFHAARDPYFQLLSESGPHPEEAMPSRRGGRRKAKKVIGTGMAAQRSSAAPKQDQSVPDPPVDGDRDAEEDPTAQSSPEEKEAEAKKRNDAEAEGHVTAGAEASARAEADAPEELKPEQQEVAPLQTETASTEDGSRPVAPPRRAETRPGSRSSVLERPRLPRQLHSSEAITCFQWLPDLFQDRPHHQFQLMQYRKKAHGIREGETPVARAIVKNTFVEVQVLDEPEAKDAALRRSASAAAALN